MRIVALLTTLLVTGCAPGARVRVARLGTSVVAAEAVAVLPLQHRFRAAPYQWLARALPLCAAVLARGGLVLYGPDEARFDPRRVRTRRDLFARLVLPRSVVRAGLDPERLLLLRGVVEERVAKTAKLLLDRGGRRRGRMRQVEVTLRVVLELLAPPRGRVLARAVGELEEDPFAPVPDHDPRPAIRALVRRLAPRLLEAAAPLIRSGHPGPPPLRVGLLPSPAVLEEFRLRDEPTLAERARRDPVLGAGLRDVHRLVLGEDVSPAELAVLGSGPAGVLVREKWGKLRPRDVIVAVSGVRVRTPWALQRAMYGAPPSAGVRFVRRGRRLRLPLAAVVGGVGAAAAGARGEGG